MLYGIRILPKKTYMYHLRNTFGKGMKRKDDALKEFVSPGIVDVLTQREGHLLSPFACCSHKVINVLIGLSTVDMNLCDFKFASQIRWFLWLDVTSQLGKISRFSAITPDGFSRNLWLGNDRASHVTLDLLDPFSLKCQWNLGDVSSQIMSWCFVWLRSHGPSKLNMRGLSLQIESKEGDFYLFQNLELDVCWSPRSCLPCKPDVCWISHELFVPFIETTGRL